MYYLFLDRNYTSHFDNTLINNYFNNLNINICFCDIFNQFCIKLINSGLYNDSYIAILIKNFLEEMLYIGEYKILKELTKKICLI